MTDKTPPTKVRAPRKGASKKAVPPQVATTPPSDAEMIARYEESRLMRQTEAAINLGIGLVLNAVGQREITIHPEALKNFNAKFRVEQEVNPDGSYTIRVTERG